MLSYHASFSVFFLIAEVIPQILNPIAKLVIHVGTSSKEAKAETEIHPVTTETKIRKCST